MHPELPGVVSDSSNLGHVYEQGGVLYLDAMIRFMDAAAEYALHQSHMLVANMCGFCRNCANALSGLAGKAR